MLTSLGRHRLSGLLMMLRLAGSGELTAVKRECLAATGPIRSGSDQPDVDWRFQVAVPDMGTVLAVAARNEVEVVLAG